MSRDRSLSPGWVAVTVAAALSTATTIRYFGAPTAVAFTEDARAPLVVDPPTLDFPMAVTKRARAAPNPFGRPGDPGVGPIDSSRELRSGPSPSEVLIAPRIVGTGRRADGVAFVGCALPGEGTTIVREGAFCGAYRLIEVGDDSVRFASEASDSLLVLGIGGGG